MRILLFTLGILLTFFARTQIGMGQWRMHIPASQAFDVAAGNGKVMAVVTSGVVEYDIEASENRVLNSLNALSDIQVTCIVFEPQSKSFFVGYENGNIDQITASSAVVNIPGIKLAQISGEKRVNKLVAANGLVYAATGFSLVVINPAQSEVLDTWYPTNGLSGVNDVAFLNDSIYALTDSRLYRGLFTNAFLADPSQWTVDTRLPVPIAGRSYQELAVYGNELYFSDIAAAAGKDSIKKLTPTGTQLHIGSEFDMEISRFEAQGELLYVYYDKLIAFNADKSVNFGIHFYGNIPSRSKRVVLYDGNYWVADFANGLVRYNHQYDYTFIQREGPPKDKFFSLSGEGGKLVVTGGTLDRVIFEYNTAGAYSFQDETWKLYDNSTQDAWPAVWDVAVSAINPDDLEEIALGSYSKDALNIIEDGQITHTYTQNNSGLAQSSVGNGNICISGLKYDDDENLWVANCYTDKPLKVRLANGTWKAFDTGGITTGRFTSEIAIDGNNNKWLGVYEKGLVAYNDNDTPENEADDIFKILSTGEGYGDLPSDNVTALAVDFDNEIWIGTDNGFAVLYNSESVFSSATIPDASRILIDFEGNLENLLGHTPITDIEIDGGNRKWIATASTGIFLLSPDGQQVIAQYTHENSPLISDNIMDMEFNDITGELFIVTDQGLVSFRTDASSEDEDYASTTVFPNPVKPDYFGPITIQGIRFDSDVKITDVAGNLVYQTTSNGGTAVWNGKRLTGEDVASGVYLIWTAANNTERKGRKVGKVVVIR